MGFGETLLASLIVAAIGAMTWFAYKHPKGYDRIWTPLMVTGMFVSAFISSYELGRTLAARDAVAAIESLELRTVVRKAVEAEGINVLWVAVGTFAFVAYHLFLGVALPRLVAADKEE